MTDDSKAISQITTLIETLFGPEGAAEQAAYIWSIPSKQDVREWLVDVYENVERIDTFMAELSCLKNNRPTTDRGLLPPKIQVIEVGKFNFPSNPTRLACSCQARIHALLGNCLNCGKVVCSQENYGDCFFCQEPKEGRMHWNGQPVDANSTAVATKNRLIQYDREGARRTKIIDDSTDWFAESTDVWTSAESRAEAARLGNEFELAKLEAKRELKISLDFSTSSVVLIDKQEGIAKVEQARDEHLQDWITSEHSLFSFIDDEANEALDSLAREH